MITQETINRVLKGYTPQSKLLKSASLEYPTIKGTFLIGPTSYYSPSLKHATDIEIQLCLNQLAYVQIAEIMNQRIIPGLNGFDFEELQGENMLITASRKKFKKSIRTDIEIQGELTLKKYKEFKNLFIGNMDFKFENSGCVGDLELVLIKPKGASK